MTSVYGLPAVEVPQPDGEVVGYLWRVVSPVAPEVRAWIVTSPKGVEYRVSEFFGGAAQCSCPAWKYNRHSVGRWCDVNGVPCCKHMAGLYEDVIKPAAESSGGD